ncbi:DUF1906 domain-containing protein [Bacillus alkalicola]|uniref:DUF1906 domain-containing protein n=2 Tax=Bacillales TaxID=1385 RepID=A0ABS6JSB7_9BACI|nr:glycoside hydrolase domain-containing protein [Bacillus alkalicola]MBU9721461.1 DUF1906 domain-containing protein [Bacillus alkalicola]
MLPYIFSFVMIIFTAFTFYIFGSMDSSEPATASSDGSESEVTENNDLVTEDETEDSENTSSSDSSNEINNTINNEINVENGNIENTIENEVNGNNGQIDNQIDNNIDGVNGEISNAIENSINGDNAQIDNHIENNITNSSNNSIDNSVTNNIDVDVDVNITNNITNVIESEAGEEAPVEENGNGTEEDENGNGEDENGKDTETNGNGEENGNGENINGQENGEATNGASEETVWGIDSASLTTEEMLACVRDNFGDPEVWARYLGDKDGVSYGLTDEEVELLHENDIDIMVIWNHFEDATGYEKGQSEAEDAIEMARDFGIPEGVAIFANVEPIYPIDAGFLLGWYDTMEESEYESGVYGIFHPDRDLYVAYEEAAEENSALLENNYVWTSSPNHGITTEENAPEYNPQAPEGSLIAGWQYGIDAETCNIDTNHFDSNVFDVLWSE